MKKKRGEERSAERREEKRLDKRKEKRKEHGREKRREKSTEGRREEKRAQKREEKRAGQRELTRKVKSAHHCVDVRTKMARRDAHGIPCLQLLRDQKLWPSTQISRIWRGPDWKWGSCGKGSFRKAELTSFRRILDILQNKRAWRKHRIRSLSRDSDV